MICVAPFAHVILLLNAYDTLGNVILKKTDCTAKFTDTVVISDQCVVRICFTPRCSETIFPPSVRWVLLSVSRCSPCAMKFGYSGITLGCLPAWKRK